MRMGTLTKRLDRRLAVDTALAGILAALGIAEAAVPFSTVTGQGRVDVAVALVLCCCVPLAVRRTYPLSVVILATLSWGVAGLLTDVLVLFWGALAPMAVAVYTVARVGRGSTPYVGLGVAALGLLLMVSGTEALQSVGELFFPSLVFLVTWLAGWVIGRKDHRFQASERRAEAVAQRSREEALLAIAEERTRIARELHDVVAHAVTAMVVQAGAAEQVMDDDRTLARTALASIRATGSQALDEMRRVVSLLRDAADDPARTHQPGLADLPALVAAASTTSTQVRLAVDGDPRPLAAGRDLAAYRIVQEAVTNAQRHARASQILVRVCYGPDQLALEVRDDGVGQQPGVPGHGLIGMRERAAAYGGTVEISSGAGFTVRATLPIREGA